MMNRISHMNKAGIIRSPYSTLSSNNWVSCKCHYINIEHNIRKQYNSFMFQG